MSALDPSDPEQQLRVAQKYARSAPELAMRIANEARTALVRIKQAQSVTKQGVTPKIQIAERIATDEGLTGEAFKRRVAELLQSPENLSEAERKGARVAEITRMLRPESGGLLLRPAERAALEAELATYALGALYAGADAYEAMEIASKLTAFTAGPYISKEQPRKIK